MPAVAPARFLLTTTFLIQIGQGLPGTSSALRVVHLAVLASLKSFVWKSSLKMPFVTGLPWLSTSSTRVPLIESAFESFGVAIVVCSLICRALCKLLAQVQSEKGHASLYGNLR